MGHAAPALGHKQAPQACELWPGLLPQGPSMLRTLCHPLWLGFGTKEQLTMDAWGPMESALTRECLSAFPSNKWGDRSKGQIQ